MMKISLLVASTFMLLAPPAAEAQPHNPSRRIIDEIRSQCAFVMPRNCVQVAREEAGIPEQRIKVAIPGQSFVVSGVQVTPLRAIHGNPKYAVFIEANFEDCGYLIKLGGKSFLQPGDTVLLEDHLFLKQIWRFHL